jgi:hypothetical protein
MELIGLWLGSLLCLFFTIDEANTGDYLRDQFEAMKPAPVFLSFHAEFEHHCERSDSRAASLSSVRSKADCSEG